MLSTPTDICEITLSFGAESSNSTSILSESIDSHPSQSTSRSRRVSLGTRSFSPQTSTSASVSRGSRMSPGMKSLTNTLGIGAAG